MKIALGADCDGFPLKTAVKDHLLSYNCNIRDFGVNGPSENKPYYTTAHEVAKMVSDGEFDRAILVCGTGMGMAIIANKHPGVFAAVYETTYATEQSRSIDNSNILTLGDMITTPPITKEIVDVWLKTGFTQGWDQPNQEWLQNSMADIAVLETQLFSS